MIETIIWLMYIGLLCYVNLYHQEFIFDDIESVYERTAANILLFILSFFVANFWFAILPIIAVVCGIYLFTKYSMKRSEK